MAKNIYGLDTARGAVTTRPARTTATSETRAWARDCTDPADPNKTKLTADWMNDISGVLRAVNDTAGITDEEGASGDNMLSEGMARYASGGQYATATGAQGEVTLTPIGDFVLPGAYFDGQRVAFRAHVDNVPGALAVGIGALAKKTVLLPDGTAPIGGEWLSGRTVEIEYVSTDLSGAGAWRMTPWGYNTEITLSRTITVDPGGGGDFLTLAAALDSLKNRRISSLATVTVVLVAGEHVHTGAYTFAHPDGVNILVRGAASTAVALSDFTVTGAAVAGDKTANRSLLVARVPSRLRMSIGASLQFEVGLRMQDLLFDADDTAHGVRFASGQFALTGIVAAIDATSAGISLVAGAQVTAADLFASACNTGIGLSGNSSLSQTGLLGVCANDGYGVSVQSGSSINQNDLHRCSGNGFSGVYVQGAVAFLGEDATGTNEADYNGTFGYEARTSGSLSVRGATSNARNNVSHGVTCAAGVSATIQGLVATANGGWGIDVRNRADLLLLSGGVVNGTNTSGAVQAVAGAYADITAMTTKTGTMSPTVNTVGNNNSYIKN